MFNPRFHRGTSAPVIELENGSNERKRCAGNREILDGISVGNEVRRPLSEIASTDTSDSA